MRMAGASAGPIRLSQLRKMRECEQVAAVCYRVRREAIEFLLVQTRRSARWTFPKGSAEPGLTHAQAAAIEAFEEAGVHGRIEEVAFLHYACRKGSDKGRSARSSAQAVVVSAHLCEVLRLCAPKESNRNRTWFSIEDAKQRLREGRKNGDAELFAGVVRQAVARIGRLRSVANVVIDSSRSDALQDDPLQKVQFEAFATDGRWRRGSFAPYLRRVSEGQLAASVRDADRSEPPPCEVLQFGPPRPINRNPRLLPAARKMKALGTGQKSG
jgi:8-oxo-dGTP pyrophosphatase MutT (NUDIX family)